MKVNIKALINRLDDLRERMNDLFDKLEKLEDLDYDIAVEDVEQYFQTDDSFNLSIALSVLEQADKLDKALDIINEKNVDIGGIKNCVNAYAYNDFKSLTETKLVKRKEITQEEFEEIRRAIL